MNVTRDPHTYLIDPHKTTPNCGNWKKESNKKKNSDYLLNNNTKIKYKKILT